jgi:hypothetical protein
MDKKMKKTLKQIREEWAKRPVEGSDPYEVEKKFPDRKNLWAEPRECIEKDCYALSFRGEARCKEHHLAWIGEQKVEAEKAEKDRVKKEKSAKWQEEQAMGRVRNTNTTCSNCGIFLRFSERQVVLREKDKLPKKPQRLEQKYRVLCEHCK